MPSQTIMDAAIPGQSLTDEPGNAKWEHPPKYTKLEDAVDYIFDKLLEEKHYNKLRLMLDEKIPVEAIVRSIILAGFSEGAFTPDLAMQLVEPVTVMIAGIGKRAGKDSVPMRMPETEPDRTLINLKRAQAPQPEESKEAPPPVVGAPQFYSPNEAPNG